MTGILETAVRATNAQFDSPEILRRLDVRLLEVPTLGPERGCGQCLVGLGALLSRPLWSGGGLEGAVSLRRTCPSSLHVMPGAVWTELRVSARARLALHTLSGFRSGFVYCSPWGVAA